MLEDINRIFVILLILALIPVYSKEKLDPTLFILLFAILGAIFTGFAFTKEASDFFAYIPLQTLTFLIFMDIFIKILFKDKVFIYLTIKLIRLTRVNIRLLFYVLCIASALVSGIMEDVSVALIFNPIIFRATKILKIKSKPFIFGTTVSILIGNLLTPFATPVSIIISSAFGLNMGWYFKYFALLFVILLASSLFLLDKFYVKKLATPSERDVRILMEIMDPELVIVNKSRFNRLLIYLVILILCIAFNFLPFLAVSGITIFVLLVERLKFSEALKRANWSLLFLYVGLFILIGCMTINQTIDMLQSTLSGLIGGSLIIAIIIIVIFGSFFSSFVSKSLTAMIFISIISDLFLATFTDPVDQDILMLAICIAVLVGGNMVPQASSFILFTIEMAKSENASDLSYQIFKKEMRKFSILSVSLTLVYYICLTLILKLL
jgi:Na+/H+ antiporter NhaD/arsenite permease-like protein